MYRRSMAVGLFVALAVACVSVAAQEKTYSPTYKAEVGDLLKYKLQMNMKMEMKTESGQNSLPNGDTNSTIVSTIKTVGIKPDGVVVNVVKVESGTIVAMGQTIPMPDVPPMTMEVDKQGRMKFRDLDKLPGGGMMSQFMNFQNMPSSGVALPDHPVKIGDTWEVEMPGMMGAAKMKAVCTLLGVEQVGGQETLKIKQAMDFPLEMNIGPGGTPTTDPSKAMMSMKGQGTVNSVSNVLEANSRILKMDGDMNMKMTMEMKGDAAKQSPFGATMNMNIAGKITMSLVSAGKVPSTPPTTTTNK